MTILKGVIALHTFWLKAAEIATKKNASSQLELFAVQNANTASTGFLATAKQALTTALGINTLATKSNKAAYKGLFIAMMALFTIIYIAAGSPSMIVAIGILTIAMFGLAYASNVLGWTLGPITPILYAFAAAIFLTGLGIGMAGAGMSLFVNSISGLAGLHGDIFKTALAIWAVAEAIDDLPLAKTVALTGVLMPLATMAPVAAVAAAGAGAMTRGAGGGTAPTAATTQAAAPIVNVKVVLGDKEMKQLVQEVEVKPYVDGKKSHLHDTITDMIANRLMSSS
jgi:hypothetical protein